MISLKWLFSVLVLPVIIRFIECSKGDAKLDSDTFIAGQYVHVQEIHDKSEIGLDSQTSIYSYVKFGDWELVNKPILQLVESEHSSILLGLANVEYGPSIPRYLVKKKGLNMGWQLDSINDPIPKYINVDSIVKNVRIAPEEMFVMEDSLLFFRDSSNETIEEVYIDKNPAGPDYPDTIKCFYLSSRDSLKISLSKAMDERKKMKLAVVLFHFRSRMEESVGVEIGKKLMFEVRPIPKPELEIELAIIERMKKDHPTGQ